MRKQFTELVALAKSLGAESALDRWIVQLYNAEMYDVVEKVHHFDRYICTLYKFTKKGAPTLGQMEAVADFCDQRGIALIPMDYTCWSEDYLPILDEYDVEIALHTVNSPEDAQTFLSQGVRGLYTDFLPPDMQANAS